MTYPPSPTIADIKDVLDIEDTSKDGVLTRLLYGAFEFTERYTRRQFSTGVATRYFDGTGKGYLVVDDFQSGSITSIKFLNADRTAWRTLTSTEYITYGARPIEPIHFRIEVVNAVSENPYRIIGPSPYVFPRGIQNVEITATWGTWGILPMGLQNIIVDLVVSKFRRPTNIRSMSVGGESLSFSDTDLTDEVRQRLEQYRRPLAEIWPD